MSTRRTAPKKRTRQEERDDDDDHDDDFCLELVVAGCGAGATTVYSGEASSCFLLRAKRRRARPATAGIQSSGIPLLVVDLGFGSQRAIAAHCKNGAFPPATPVYISHNHSDHSAELPVVAAVELARRVEESGAINVRFSPFRAAAFDLIAEHRTVMQKLVECRLDELRSMYLPMHVFATLCPLNAGRDSELGADGGRTIYSLDSPEGPPALPWELGLELRRARHSEPCFGFVLFARRRRAPRWQEEEQTRASTPGEYGGWTPILGWGGDSGADERHYRALARAPVVLVDARPGEGTEEHASVAEVLEACAPGGALSSCERVVTYGHGDERARGQAAALVRRAAAQGLRRGGGGPAVEVAAPGLVVAVPWPRRREEGG